MNDIISNFSSFILHPELHGIWLAVKTILIILTLAMIAAILYFIIVSEWFLERYWSKFSDFWQYNSKESQGRTLKTWQKIKKRLTSKRETDWKLAIIEADDLVKDLASKMGYVAASLPESVRLMAEKNFPDLDLNKILEAHETRRSISSDRNFQLSLDKTRQALEGYEKFMKQTEILG